MDNKPVMLITSIGKRVQLIEHLKKSFKIIGVDAGNDNPTKYFVDMFYEIPKAVEENYLEVLINICKSENVQLLVPLYEGEFEILNENKLKFEDVNTKVVLSSREVINVCKNKEETYKFFTLHNVETPKVYSNDELDDIIIYGDIDKFPLFIKPKDGMGSRNTFKINNMNELIFFKDYVKNPVIQECIDGDEYTVDCLVDFNGNPVYVVPRKRLEVRSGEVVKSRTIHDIEIIDKTIEVIKILNKLRDEKKYGAVGPLTIQFFKTVSGKIYLLEINPRFGGGVPLSFECNADYGKALRKMISSEKVEFKNEFLEKTMLRYDQAVFI
ncbi:ATP-grasp domain-containing protein [Clostridium butyricum]|uniref:ATP-grasp domain-containing protein n=1 Tax=Clostridium butyricum TaxID=1492 RepID=UPI0013D3D033|nr:ATP-grasp domain-containing protein [Clostridium butyricum]MCQ2022235.1 ATP-grasp domain-containing protein [Clostridium butyricum]NFB70088.1 ATP-grasp domain-containing protein [Clostridium butyricum]NFB89875.1 ATP-grasp domain-containing protein [Clostridium butyricum]